MAGAETDNFVSIVNGGSGVPDGVTVSGQIVGTTLIISTSTGGTVNIPLTGVEAAIDFANLNAVQKSALHECLRGETYQDAFGNDIGYLLTLI